jgi:hypothetical protein
MGRRKSSETAQDSTADAVEDQRVLSEELRESGELSRESQEAARGGAEAVRLRT